MQERTAKLFINGRNQAVRLPKDLEFEGINEVTIRKDGKSLIITPVRKNWLSLLDQPLADDDFMTDRPGVFDNERVKL
ncbi:MAG: hypothetical protein COB04_07220 [Gammaproteobacteria bacterium]|nr:MAG: hypothetical protein COB04_07220 [Gammaproteobacteria bacterium]